MKYYANLQQSAEKVSKQLESQLSEANSRIDEANRIIADLNSGKSRLQSEAVDLTRQLEEAESRVGQLTKEKSSLASQLDEAKRSVEEESRVCYILLMIQNAFFFISGLLIYLQCYTVYSKRWFFFFIDPPETAVRGPQSQCRLGLSPRTVRGRAGVQGWSPTPAQQSP